MTLRYSKDVILNCKAQIRLPFQFLLSYFTQSMHSFILKASFLSLFLARILLSNFLVFLESSEQNLLIKLESITSMQVYAHKTPIAKKFNNL